MCGRVESGIITWAACGVCAIASVWVCEQQEICTIRSIAINMRMKMRDERRVLTRVYVDRSGHYSRPDYLLHANIRWIIMKMFGVY